MPAVDYEKLAPYYDRLVPDDADVEFFVELSRQAPGSVLELMAGTGRVSIPVASAGVSLTCVDSSPAMLDELRRKLASRRLSAEVIRQDVTRLDLASRFALAFVAFNSFEELAEAGDRERLLRSVLAHLLPRGRFVCTLHDPDVCLRDVGPGRERQRRFEDRDGRQLVLRVKTAFDRQSGLVHGRETLEVVSTGEVIADLPLCFRLTSHSELRSLARRAGFIVEGVYGGYDYDRYTPSRSAEMVWMLARPDAV